MPSDNFDVSGETLGGNDGFIRASARFMFEGSLVQRLRELFEKEDNIERMQQLWAAGRDIRTGEPLRGEDYLIWLESK